MSNPHLDYLCERAPELLPLRDQIDASFRMLRESVASGGKLLLCGNGGSAADADHWAGELLKGFKSKRALSPSARAGLPSAIADSLQGAIPAIPLTGFAALTPAFANDVAGDLAFAQLTHALGRPGDVFIGLSTSGNARNVCAAAPVARPRAAHPRPDGGERRHLGATLRNLPACPNRRDIPRPRIPPPNLPLPVAHARRRVLCSKDRSLEPRLLKPPSRKTSEHNSEGPRVSFAEIKFFWRPLDRSSMRRVISHCLPRDCGFARQGIARLRLRSTFSSTSESKVVELPRRTHAVG
jgi:D-sedoheptulose 7-phosphate isomerase